MTTQQEMIDELTLQFLRQKSRGDKYLLRVDELCTELNETRQQLAEAQRVIAAARKLVGKWTGIAELGRLSKAGEIDRALEILACAKELDAVLSVTPQPVSTQDAERGGAT